MYNGVIVIYPSKVLYPLPLVLLSQHGLGSQGIWGGLLYFFEKRGVLGKAGLSLKMEKVNPSSELVYFKIKGVSGKDMGIGITVL